MIHLFSIPCRRWGRRWGGAGRMGRWVCHPPISFPLWTHTHNHLTGDRRFCLTCCLTSVHCADVICLHIFSFLLLFCLLLAQCKKCCLCVKWKQMMSLFCGWNFGHHYQAVASGRRTPGSQINPMYWCQHPLPKWFSGRASDWPQRSNGMPNHS